MRSSSFHIIILVFFLPFVTLGQKNIDLEITFTGGKENLNKKINYKQKHIDTVQVTLEINKVVKQLHKQSYLTASANEIIWSQEGASCEVDVGKPYQWAVLKKGNLSEDLLKKVDFKEKLYKGKRFHYLDFVALEDKILREAENNGYPFASIELDSLKIENEQIEADLLFIPGVKIYFDSIGVIGKAQVSRNFLKNYLQIKEGELFDQSRIDKINPLLSKLNIVHVKREPEIRFINGKAYVYLFLEQKKTTSIDGIAGLQQDKIDQDKILLTGEFNLSLRNILHSGKRGEIHWKKLNRNTSSLESSYFQPAIFGSPIEFYTWFNFLNQDTTYLAINPRVGFKYNFIKWGSLGFFYELLDTRLQDTSIFSRTTVLPSFADSKLRSYGLSYEWSNLDNYFLPRKGLLIKTEFSVGSKELNMVLPKKLYEGVALNTIQYSGKGKIEYHLPISQNMVLLQKVTGAWIDNDRLFINDLYRIGGINSLRGFREFSFFASKYAIETMELRLFTEEMSYFMVFVDYGHYLTEVEGAYERNFPLGFGGGISFATRAGIFNMVYALGKESNSTINFNNSIVNFGLTSRF